MSLTIQQYCPEDAVAWDAFVHTSRNGTLFHTRRFLSYHQEGTFTDASLIIRDAQTIVALLPAALVDGVLVSHPGASYGGLVLPWNSGMKETGEVIDAVMAYAQQKQYLGIRFLRLPPPSVRRRFSDDQEYWLYQRGWKTFRFELATSLFLRGLTEETLLSSYDGKCRNSVRQGMKSGLTVALSDDIDTYWPMLEATLEARHHTKPTHTLQQFARLREMCPQEARLITASHEGKIIAGIVFVTLHDKAVYTLYIAQDFAFQHLRPLPVLVHALAELSIREGRDVLHFGISTEDSGKEVNDGLFFFKESFGGVSVRRESWEYTFPL